MKIRPVTSGRSSQRACCIALSFGALVFLGFPGVLLASPQSAPIEGEIWMHGRQIRAERIWAQRSAREAAADSASVWQTLSAGSAQSSSPHIPVLILHRPPWWIVTRYLGDQVEAEQWRDTGPGAAEGIRTLLPLHPVKRVQPTFPRLAPAEHLGLAIVSESIVSDRVRTLVYRSLESPRRLHRRWLEALVADGFLSISVGSSASAQWPGCVSALQPRATGCTGMHRSGQQELIWTISPDGTGAAVLVVHQARTQATTRGLPELLQPAWQAFSASLER